MRRRRVLVDSNVYISYLLRPDSDSSVCRVLEALISGRCVLLLPADLAEEILRAVKRKPYLSARIPANSARRLVDLLLSISEPIERIEEEAPRVVRDPEDNFLLMYALAGRADYLVTGDLDLLTIGRVGELRILSPQEFAELAESGPEV
jgi:uncharacterized protein